MGIMKNKRKRSPEDGGKKPKSKVLKKSVPEDVTDDTKNKPQKTTEFDIKYFRKQLNMKPAQLVSLTQFIDVCTRPTSESDYMALYLENGGNANEILKLLDDQNKKNPTVITPIFNILHLLLLKIQSANPHLFQAAEETCRFFLNSYVSTIGFMLSEKSNSKQQRITLKLLASIVTFSPELGFTVLNQLSLQPKTLIHLVKNVHGKDKDDVRSTFINFVLAFLSEGNTSLIKSALDKYGLLTLMFPGLVKDNSETVLTVLNTFSKNIIHNINISKTIKIKTFNQNIILSLFNIFNWNDSTQKSEDEKSNAKKEVEEAVFNILLVLCTSHKHGIYFTDKSLGTSDVPTSQYLWKALESLEAPWNNKEAGLLIIDMVSKCPDLYRPVIRLVEQSYEPRNSELWYKTTIFFMNLLKAMTPENIISRSGDMNAVQITNFVCNVYLPIPILKVSSKVLITCEDEVKNQIILLLHVMLSSVNSYLLLLDNEKSNVCSVLKSKLEEFIPKHFPSTDVLVTVLHSMLDNTLQPEIDSDATKNTFTIPLPNQSRLLINVLDLLLLYNKVLPNSLDPISAMLDSKRLFDKMESICEVDKGELKLKITMFLLCADKFAFAPDKPLFKEILQSMFEVFISSDLYVSKISRVVLYNILETTGIFEKSKSEIDLLLSVVHYVGSKLGHSIAKNVVSVVENVYQFSDKYVSSLIFNNEEENTEGLIKHFDIFISNLQYYKGHTLEKNIVFEKTFLTHFVIGLLEHLKSNKTDGFNLLTNLFIINLLHYQDTAEYIYQISETYPIDLPVKKYILSWKSKPISLDLPFIDKLSVLHKLSKALLSESPIDLDEVFAQKEQNQISLYFSHADNHNAHCLTENESEIFSWFNMILFTVTRQSSLDIFSECKMLNANKFLNYVLLKCKDNKTRSSKVLKLMIGNCLSHKIVLKKFSPLKKSKNLSDKYLSEFVLNFVKFCTEHNLEVSMVNSLLRPYKHKIFLALMTYLKKTSKSERGPNIQYVNEILSTINLDLSDATLIMMELLKLDVKYMVSDENQASSWVYVLCHIINQFIKNETPFHQEIIQGIASLYSKIILQLDVVINITDFEEALYNYLISNPEIVFSIPGATFEAIFSVKHVSKFTSKIISLLLKLNANFLPRFCKNVIKSDILEKRELVLPLTSAAFGHHKFECNHDIILAIYNNYKSNIQKVLEKPHKASQIYIDNSDLIVKLINACMDKVECGIFLKKVHKFDSVEIFHINILEAIFSKAQSDCEANIISNNYLLSILHLAIIELKKEIPEFEKLKRIYNCLKKFLLVYKTNGGPDLFCVVKENAIWQNFFKSILKYYLQIESKELVDKNEVEVDETALFSIVSSLINLIYPNDDKDILNLFEMTSSHSEFLNIMLSNRHLNVKTQLVKLLFTMVSKNKDILKPAHTTVYLSAYHGSLNLCDRYILALLKFYERNGQAMTEYQPYLWGDIAANHYAVRSKRTKSSLWSNPTANHILNLLDREMIERTVRYYPTHVRLDVEEDLLNGTDFLFSISKNGLNCATRDIIEDSLKKKLGKVLDSKKNCNFSCEVKSKHYKLALTDLLKPENSLQCGVNDTEIYDPAFLMPLLNFVVTPGSAVSCHRIVRYGVLAIPFMALSSNCPMMRAVALNILQRFYALLESEMFYRNDKVLWSQFIDTVRNSLDSTLPASENEQTIYGMSVPRLPAVGAIYLARAAMIMTHPLDPMFKPINNFIISKQSINFSVVPDFLELFHNTDIQYIDRRTWMLKILRDGTKTFADVKVLLKSVIYKIVLDFYSSNLSDIKQKLLILEILNSTICIPKAAKILCDGYGLFAWLNCSIKNIHCDNKSLISMAIQLISSLWMSLACEPLSKVPNIMEMSKAENVIDTVIGKCFKISENIQSSLLCLLIELLPKLSGASLPDFKMYLSVLRKISKSSLNNISKHQIQTLLKECESLLHLKKVSLILASVIESSKIDQLLSSYLVLDISMYDSEDKFLVTKYLHEIIMVWIS